LFAGLDWPSLRPAQQLLAQQPGDADPNRFIAAAQSADGPVVVYTPGDPIHLTRPLTDARWYNPRTGEWSGAGSGAVFTPVENEDWVLIG
ncbi:MAG: putative collagen-binding domain-containing protein, partial [Caldilineaceae bacterium]